MEAERSREERDGRKTEAEKCKTIPHCYKSNLHFQLNSLQLFSEFKRKAFLCHWASLIRSSDSMGSSCLAAWGLPVHNALWLRELRGRSWAWQVFLSFAFTRLALSAKSRAKMAHLPSTGQICHLASNVPSKRSDAKFPHSGHAQPSRANIGRVCFFFLSPGCCRVFQELFLFQWFCFWLREPKQPAKHDKRKRCTLADTGQFIQAEGWWCSRRKGLGIKRSVFPSRGCQQFAAWQRVSYFGLYFPKCPQAWMHQFLHGQFSLLAFWRTWFSEAIMAWRCNSLPYGLQKVDTRYPQADTKN